MALGTDGVASNNSHDLFGEIKLAAILHKGIGLDPTAVTARQALEMATVSRARALGRNTGVIAPGKTADLILVDLAAPNLFPCHDVEGGSGLFGPRLQRCDEYGPGTGHI